MEGQIRQARGRYSSIDFFCDAATSWKGMEGLLQRLSSSKTTLVCTSWCCKQRVIKKNRKREVDVYAFTTQQQKKYNVHSHTCMWVQLYVSTKTYVRSHVFTYFHVYARMSFHIHMYACTNTCMKNRMSKDVYMSMCTCRCIHTDIDFNMHMFLFMSVFTC